MLQFKGKCILVLNTLVGYIVYGLVISHNYEDSNILVAKLSHIPNKTKGGIQHSIVYLE